ncbi:MAG TPA: sulfatase, partial [Vicinamibacterales bacterium]|nr:sulfatase [Vicinamibacterales bacterium]
MFAALLFGPAGNAVPPPSLSAQITLAAAAAIVIGVVDAALVALSLAGAQGAFQFVPLRIWLVAPMIWTVIAAITVAGLLLFTRRWIGVLTPGILAIILLAIRLHNRPALLIVAIAVLTLAMVVTHRPIYRLMARPRHITIGGILGCLIASATALATPFPVSVEAVGDQRDAGPNVILIFLDTVRYDAVFDGAGGVHKDLPTLVRLREESTVFTRAYATSPWTLPSHLSTVTGLPAHELGVSFDAQIYDRATQTLAERFRERGYRTSAVISNSFLNAGSGFARGFDTFQQAQAALDVCRTAPGLLAETYWVWFSAAVCNWTGGEVTRRAAALMDDEKGPFFLTLNYMDAHDPYYVERSCGEGRGYREALRCLDRQLAPIVNWQSPRRPTVVAVVGDHGEQFGEHGLQRHGNSLFVQLLHVPLMIRTTAASSPRVDGTPTSIAAVPWLLGARTDRRPEGPALALLEPPAAGNQPAEWSATDGAWHLIVRERGGDSLYFLPDDQVPCAIGRG